MMFRNQAKWLKCLENNLRYTLLNQHWPFARKLSQNVTTSDTPFFSGGACVVSSKQGRTYSKTSFPNLQLNVACLLVNCMCYIQKNA